MPTIYGLYHVYEDQDRKLMQVFKSEQAANDQAKQASFRAAVMPIELVDAQSLDNVSQVYLLFKAVSLREFFPEYMLLGAFSNQDTFEEAKANAIQAYHDAIQEQALQGDSISLDDAVVFATLALE